MTNEVKDRISTAKILLVGPASERKQKLIEYVTRNWAAFTTEMTMDDSYWTFNLPEFIEFDGADVQIDKNDPVLVWYCADLTIENPDTAVENINNLYEKFGLKFSVIYLNAAEYFDVWINDKIPTYIKSCSFYYDRIFKSTATPEENMDAVQNIYIVGEAGDTRSILADRYKKDNKIDCNIVETDSTDIDYDDDLFDYFVFFKDINYVRSEQGSKELHSLLMKYANRFCLILTGISKTEWWSEDYKAIRIDISRRYGGCIVTEETLDDFTPVGIIQNVFGGRKGFFKNQAVILENLIFKPKVYVISESNDVFKNFIDSIHNLWEKDKEIHGEYYKPNFANSNEITIDIDDDSTDQVWYLIHADQVNQKFEEICKLNEKYDNRFQVIFLEDSSIPNYWEIQKSLQTSDIFINSHFIDECPTTFYSSKLGDLAEARWLDEINKKHQENIAFGKQKAHEIVQNKESLLKFINDCRSLFTDDDGNIRPELPADKEYSFQELYDELPKAITKDNLYKNFDFENWIGMVIFAKFIGEAFKDVHNIGNGEINLAE